MLFVLVFSSCNKHKQYEGKTIFRYNIAEGLTSLDPAFASTMDNASTVNHIFNGLVQLNAEMEVIPCIAKRWEVDSTATVYTFHLRDDVYFHPHAAFEKDSRKVIAGDFIYSFHRLIDPELLSPGKWVMESIATQGDGRLQMTAIDDTTLEIRLNRPFTPFLGLLTMKYCSVVPREVVEAAPKYFRQQAVGTGPFKFQYWKEGGKLVLVKNENYFETDEADNKLPYLDAIAISFIKDEEIAFLKFLQQDFDYLSNLKGSYKDELLTPVGELRPKYQERITLRRGPFLNTEYLGFYVDERQENKMVSSKAFRKGLNFAFDRRKMLMYLRNGAGTPALAGFIPKGLPAFKDTAWGFTYNPDSANFYLDQARAELDQPLTGLKLSTPSQYLDICEYLQHQFRQFGVKLDIEVNQAATNNEMIAHGKAGFFRKSWVADYPDAENYLSLFYSGNFAPDGPNYTHFQNADYDRLYEKAVTIAEDQYRYSYYRQMDSIIIAEAPVIPLFYDELFVFTQPYVEGIDLNRMNLLSLKYARK